MTKSFNEYFKETILKNKRLVVAAIIVTVLAFGFTITNFSIGLDDAASYHYLHTNGWGNMIQQGRLSHVLLEWLTGSLTFIPFMNDFIGAALFCFSALVFCGFFQYITDGKLSEIALFVFAGIYLTYSIVCEKFIYNLDVIVVMLSYVCVAYSLTLVCDFFNRGGAKQIKPLILSCLVLTVGLGSYESFIFLYICGVFSIFILESIVLEKKLVFKDVLHRGIIFLAVLLAAMVLYYGTVFLVQLCTNQLGLFQRDSAFSEDTSFVYACKKTILNIYAAVFNLDYLPMKEFVAFSVVGILIAAACSIKRKSWLLFLCYIGLYGFNFGIHIISGSFMYRAAQTLCFFIAFISMLIANYACKNKIGNKLVPIVACWLVFIQVADLNLQFYNDYSRYKKDEFVINTVSTKLLAEYDVLNKPVVFTNVDIPDKPRPNYLMSPSAGQVNGASAIYLNCHIYEEPTSPTLINLFKMHGYNFIIEPTVEQAVQGARLAVDMEYWPEEGSIQEFDDFIVVHF